MPYRQRGTTNWGISWTDIHGTRHRRTSGTSSFREAKRLEQELRAAGAQRAGGRDDPTVQQLLLHYLADHQDNRAHERDLYATKALLSYFHSHRHSNLDRSSITGYIKARQVSHGTVRKELALLVRSINYWNRTRDCSLENTVSRHLPPSSPGSIRWITRDEARRLIGSTDPKAPYLSDFITLALATGCRRNELLLLTWDRVDLDQALIYLDRQHQKSGRQGTVALNRTALDVLRRRRREATGPDVFPVRSIKRSFATACRRAGITNFRIHDLRHTACAWMVQAGVPLRDVSEAMRHADIQTTMRYAHLAPENVRRAVAAIDFDHDADHDTGTSIPAHNNLSSHHTDQVDSGNVLNLLEFTGRSR